MSVTATARLQELQSPVLGEDAVIFGEGDDVSGSHRHPGGAELGDRSIRSNGNEPNRWVERFEICGFDSTLAGAGDNNLGPVLKTLWQK